MRFNRSERAVRVIPTVPDGKSKITFTVQLEAEMDWNACLAGKHFAGDGGIFDPTNPIKDFPSDLQKVLARNLFDFSDGIYTQYRITKISYPTNEVNDIYSNIKSEDAEKEKLAAIEELKRLEAEEMQLQTRKQSLKAKAGL